MSGAEEDWAPVVDKPLALVIGARHGSLGAAIADELEMTIRVRRAGISTEPFHLDCTDQESIFEAYALYDPAIVVCTVGVNAGGPFYGLDWWGLAQEAMEFNYLAPMKALSAYEQHLGGMPGVFIAISSNSAQIPRSSSAAYCASKAALSMGVRCAARDLTRAGKPLRCWCYEPGALAGTPMTKDVRRQLGKDVPMSRMLTDPEGLAVADVARIVARDALESAEVLHGCAVRLDAGEQ